MDYVYIAVGAIIGVICTVIFYKLTHKINDCGFIEIDQTSDYPLYQLITTEEDIGKIAKSNYVIFKVKKKDFTRYNQGL